MRGRSGGGDNTPGAQWSGTHRGALLGAAVVPPATVRHTHSGATARSIARFKLPVWTTAVSSQEKTCNDLMFSYGVRSVHEPDHPDDWSSWARNWLNAQEVAGNIVVLTEGPSTKHPNRNNRMEIIDLDRKED